MSWKDIKAGDKVGRAKGIRTIRSPQKGTLGIEVMFEFEEGGGFEQLNHVFWLTEKTMERAMDTLVHVLGYNGDDSTDAEGNFTNPEVLDWKREVKLVVNMREYTNKDGEERTAPYIQWVNPLGGGGFDGVDTNTVKTELKALGFKAAFLAAKKGVAPAPSAKPVTVKKQVADEEIPF